MGYRYSRRIKICKGVHLNVSKSGVGISLGVRGASISTGPRGTYINTRIPGTGISCRQKIGSTPTKSYSPKNLMLGEFKPGSTFSFQIDNDGNESFLLIDPNGNPFTNDAFVRKIKRTSEYKEMVEQTRKAKNDFIKKQNDDVVLIYKSTPGIISVDDVIRERDDTSGIKQNFYYPLPFDEPQPRIDDFYDDAKKFAESNVKTFFFWKKKELVSTAIQKKMEELYDEALKNWKNRQDVHFEKEWKIKEVKDIEYKKEYDLRLKERSLAYEQVLNPSEDYLLDTVSDVLSQVELPVDFAIDYAVSDRNVELDIDLPEIENLPQITSSILQSGKLSIKQKTISDMNKDYATCVIGMSFFFAGILFNISPTIESISMAGYTQRLSKKTGNVEDQYVYSVTYTREKFASMNILGIDPLEAIKNFEHTIDISPKFELKTIDVKDSENRKTNSGSQIIQTEYYRVEPAKKETEPQIVTSQLDNSSSPLIQEQSQAAFYERQEQESKRKQEEEYQKTQKGCLGCLTVIIILFVLFVLYCMRAANENSGRRPAVFRGRGTYKYKIIE